MPQLIATVYSLLFRTGEKWRIGRSKLNKQSKLANVFGYCPGFNRVSDSLIQNIIHMQDKDGCVEDVKTLIMYWTLDGKREKERGV